MTTEADLAPTRPSVPVVRALLLLAVGAALVGSVLLGFGLLPAEPALWVSDIAFPVASWAAAATLAVAARSADGKERAGWRLVAAGVGSWAVAETLWSVIELTSGEVPFPGVTDVFYLLGYPLVISGVVALPWVRTLHNERLRLVLDAAAGCGALFSLSWVLYLGELVGAYAASDPVEALVALTYPVADAFLVLAAVMITMTRGRSWLGIRPLVFAISMAAYGWADSAYLVAEEAATYESGAWFDALWLMAYAGFAYLGWHVVRHHLKPKQVEASGWTELTLAYASLALAIGSWIASWVMNRPDAVAGALLASVATVVALRQGVAIYQTREAVERERDELVGSISHELRTPLTAITGFTSVLRTEGDLLPQDTRRELLETVDRETQYITRIVTDLVDLARNRLESTSLDPTWLPMRTTVRAAEALVPDLGSVAVDVPLGLEMFGDRNRITQVIINLLTNAGRYGSGSVLALARARGDGGVIEIHDNGSGVPAEYLDRIWHRFERGAHRYNSTVPGSGLGLSIALSLVEAHGGKIDYRVSERLGGACFSVWLPQARHVDTLSSIVG